MPQSILISFIIIGFSVGLSVYFGNDILKHSTGRGKLQGVAKAVAESLSIYLKRKYLIFVSIFTIIALFFGWAFGFVAALSLLGGGLVSTISRWSSMRLSMRANIGVAQAATDNEQQPAHIAFLAGTTSGLVITSLAIGSMALIYVLTDGNLNALVGFTAGSAITAIVSRIGGGIFTKSADVGADLVGKLEAGIPEDDPRNPAVIADNVGDIIGNSGAMMADIFETITITLFAAILIGRVSFGEGATETTFPFLVISTSIVSLLISVTGYTFRKRAPARTSILSSIIIASFGSLILLYPLSLWQFGPEYNSFPSIFGSLFIGMGTGILNLFVTEFYASTRYTPTRELAKASQFGQATNLISGLALSQKAPTLPIILLLTGIITAFHLFGMYGIALMALGLLISSGPMIALTVYGPILDAADGLADIADLGKETRERTATLDSLGNTVKTLARTYTILTSLLAALLLFIGIVDQMHFALETVQFSLVDPYLIAGLLVGGLLPYYYSSLLLNAVAKTAQQVVAEVRRQFREIEGVIEGSTKPDYQITATILTSSSFKFMILPVILPILLPLLAGFIFGLEALSGLLIGAMISGVILSLSMTIGGSAWDNAKKYIEEGNYGGMNSVAHEASIIGDTVGDPFKDTAGPALNNLVKLMNLVALLALPFLL